MHFGSFSTSKGGGVECTHYNDGSIHVTCVFFSMGLCPRHVTVMVSMVSAIDRPPYLSIFHKTCLDSLFISYFCHLRDLKKKIIVWWLVMSEMRTDIFGSDTAYNLFVKEKHQAH